MIDGLLLQHTLWLGGLAIGVAVARLAVFNLFKSLPSWTHQSLNRLHAMGVWHAASRAGTHLDRRAPRPAAFLKARFDRETFLSWPLTAASLCTIIIAAWFALVARTVLSEQGAANLDNTILAALSGIRNEPGLSLFSWVTRLGGNAALASAALVAGVLLWAGRHRPLLLGLWVAAVGSQTTLWVGKFAFNRARPEFLSDITASSPSFPSGHTAGAMAIYGFIAYAAASLVPESRARVEIAFWAALAILMVGFSRIYLHVHYPSDVVGGLLIGGLWLLVGGAIARWQDEKRGLAPKAGNARPGARSATTAPRRYPNPQNDA